MNTPDVPPVVLPEPHGVVHSQPRLLVAATVPSLEALPVLCLLDALLYLALILHIRRLVLRQEDPHHKAHSLCLDVTILFNAI